MTKRKKDQGTNIDLPNSTYKTKDRATRIQLTTGGECKLMFIIVSSTWSYREDFKYSVEYKQWISSLVNTTLLRNNLYPVHSKPKYLKAKLSVKRDS